MSWAERGLPPGWAVSELERNHARPERRWWCRCVGQAYYLKTEEDAHRVAWERWALDVLGFMEWSPPEDPEPDDDISYIPCLQAAMTSDEDILVCMEPWQMFSVRHMADSFDVGDDLVLTLVRAAGMLLAYFDPEVWTQRKTPRSP